MDRRRVRRVVWRQEANGDGENGGGVGWSTSRNVNDRNVKGGGEIKFNFWLGRKVWEESMKGGRTKMC